MDYEKEDEPPFHNGMHTDLKRDVEHGARRRAGKVKNPQNALPLFEKYQFLSPGQYHRLVNPDQRSECFANQETT